MSGKWVADEEVDVDEAVDVDKMDVKVDDEVDNKDEMDKDA